MDSLKNKDSNDSVIYVVYEIQASLHSYLSSHGVASRELYVVYN